MADALKRLDPMDLPMQLDFLFDTLRWYRLRVPAGHTEDDVLEARYWVHVWRRLQLFDTFTFISDTFDFDARIIMIRPGELKWRIIRPNLVKPGTAEKPFHQKDDVYIVMPVGKTGIHQVKVKLTGAVMADGLDSEGAAAECRRLNELARAEAARGDQRKKAA